MHMLRNLILKVLKTKVADVSCEITESRDISCSIQELNGVVVAVNIVEDRPQVHQSASIAVWSNTTITNQSIAVPRVLHI